MAFYRENPGHWTMEEFEHRWKGMELMRKLERPLSAGELAEARKKMFEQNKAQKDREKQKVL